MNLAALIREEFPYRRVARAPRVVRARHSNERPVRLSPCEQRIKADIEAGLTPQEIAAKNRITRGTLKVYFYKLTRKIGMTRFGCAVAGSPHPINEGLVSTLPKALRGVALGVAKGLIDKEIAEEMKLSYGTVRSYKARLLQQFNLNSRLELAKALRCPQEGDQLVGVFE